MRAPASCSRPSTRTEAARGSRRAVPPAGASQSAPGTRRTVSDAPSGSQSSRSTTRPPRARSPVTDPRAQATGSAGRTASDPASDPSSIAATSAGRPPLASRLKMRPASCRLVRAGLQWSTASHSTHVSAASPSPRAAAARPTCTRPNAMPMRPGGAVGSSARQAIFAATVAAAAARSRADSSPSPTNAGSISSQSGCSCDAWRCAIRSRQRGSSHSASVPSSATRFGGRSRTTAAQRASRESSPRARPSRAVARAASRRIDTSMVASVAAGMRSPPGVFYGE